MEVASIIRHWWYGRLLQSQTKYLKQILAIMWNGAQQEKLNFHFKEFFASIDKIFSLEVRLATRMHHVYY